ncbi:MAG: hypothetical protein AAFU55_16805, partial [Pseudomonadota bacterium]
MIVKKLSRMLGGEPPEAVVAAHMDEDWYRTRYAAAIGPDETPAAHYLRVGSGRGNRPAPWFEPRFYREAYPAILASGIDPFLHYVTAGKAEGRHPSEAALLATGFNQDFYLARYPDVADGREDPIEHFIRVGDRQSRNPTRWFSTADYRASLAARRAPQSVLKTAFGRYLLHDGKVSPAVKTN